ncbi:MAG: RagB/SusD family nutrient uptake outer membrane protein [Mangrovibacterium sp.]
MNAAADINMVRNRAKATPVDPDDVNIDYILDERLRELLMEEFRTATLNRLGLSYDRMRRLNEYCGNQIREHHNLWPIPFSEIERNTGALLEQNPGYN